MTEATISKGKILISVDEKAMRQLVEGCWATENLDVRQQITDVPIYMKEVVDALNADDEQGTTLIHRMFDAAILQTLENGAEGIEDHPKQDA